MWAQAPDRSDRVQSEPATARMETASSASLSHGHTCPVLANASRHRGGCDVTHDKKKGSNKVGGRSAALKAATSMPATCWRLLNEDGTVRARARPPTSSQA
jgi:hypothetical protein